MNQNDANYLTAGKKPLTTESSILVSSSKYLNSARMRKVFADSGLRKNGWDVPLAYLVPEAIQAFEEVNDLAGTLQLIEDEKKKNAEFSAWLDARYLSKIRTEDLKDYRQGSLGAVLYEFAIKTGYDLDFLFNEPPKNDYEYLIKRIVQGHDITHMVTGLDPTPIGENALIMANYQSMSCHFSSPELAAELGKFGMFLLTTGLMQTTLHYPKVLPTYLEGVRIGMEMGKKLKKPLFYVRWEDYWDWTIPQIREELNIVGAPENDVWAWTDEAWRG